MLILFLLQGWGRWLWKWVGLKIVFFFFFFQSESNAAKTATEKHDYSIFVYRIVTLHDVFIMCNIFCSKHTWGRDMLMGGLWSWRWGWGGGSLPKANRNAIDKCFSSKLVKSAASHCRGRIWQHVLLDMRNREKKMGGGQLREAHHRQFGDTTDYFEIYSIYPQILYHRGVSTTFRSLVFDRSLVHWYCWGDSSGMTLTYCNILNAGSAPFLVSPVWIIFFIGKKEKRIRRDILNSFLKTIIGEIMDIIINK